LTLRGLTAALDALADRLPLPVRLDVTDRRLPEPIEASVYFFCSEALTNVVKHAQASSGERAPDDTDGSAGVRSVYRAWHSTNKLS
jgi:nitrate/nitrite-specific signal transduction histidine kinase